MLFVIAIFSLFALLGVYLLSLHGKYRLLVGESVIRQTGVFRDDEVAVNSVDALKRRCFPRGGSVVMTGHMNPFKIELGTDGACVSVAQYRGRLAHAGVPVRRLDAGNTLFARDAAAFSPLPNGMSEAALFLQGMHHMSFRPLFHLKAIFPGMSRRLACNCSRQDLRSFPFSSGDNRPEP